MDSPETDPKPGQSPLPGSSPEPGTPVPTSFPFATWGPWLATGGAVLALIFGQIIALPIYLLAGGEDWDNMGWAAKAAIQLCVGIGFVVVPWVIAREFPDGINWRQAFQRLGFRQFRPGNAAKWIGIGFLAYLAFALFYAMVFGAPEQEDFTGELGPVAVQVFLVVLIAPIGEEVCFRGLLFGGFRKKFPLPLAALGAGLVFGLLHFSTGISAVPQLIVLGAIFAVVFEKTGSIWPPIIFHAINNAYALAILNS
ncbi:MAG: CPBP family intramembrane metalloprotease [Solirubrobacterales bacterium]|mgnify:CR=1 FL=1|nr:CPBP family intramembrane metalloprotease [Solirubrobacterales bacterium]HMT05411.1 type II CAAX endopeptidase family protein [Solirubrobacterales bacterium]